MPVQFCTDCGDLLPMSRTKNIKCECCGLAHSNELLSYESNASTNDFPSELRDKRSAVQQSAKSTSSMDTWSTIDEQCRNCGAHEVRYTALQLRSADEGTTMFYWCRKCSHRWNEDN